LKVIILFICLLSIYYGQAQTTERWHPPNYNLTSVDLKNLDGVNFLNMTADKDDRLWINTSQGIYRYNGLAAQKIPFSQDGISQPVIISLFADTKGTIWASAWNGLGRFDNDSNKFIYYSKYKDLSFGAISNLVEYNNQIFFTSAISSTKTILFKIVEDKIFLVKEFETNSDDGLAMDAKTGKLFLCLGRSKIVEYDTKLNKIVAETIYNTNGRKGIQVHKIIVDLKGKCWLISLNAGLVALEDIKDGLYVKTLYKNIDKEQTFSDATPIPELFGDSIIVINSFYRGIVFYNIRSKLFSKPINLTRDSIKDFESNSFFYHKASGKFFALCRKKIVGINFLDKEIYNLKIPKNVPFKSVSSVINNPFTNLESWILLNSSNGSLLKLNNFNFVSTPEFINNSLLLTNNQLLNGTFFNKELLFITSAKGLLEVNFKTNKIELHKFEKPIEYSTSGITKCIDSCIILANGSSLLQYDMQTKKITKLLSNVVAIHEGKHDENGDLHFVSQFDCYKIHKKTHQIEKYKFTYKDNFVKQINDICITKTNIFLGSSNGLFVVDRKTNVARLLENGFSDAKYITDVFMKDSILFATQVFGGYYISKPPYIKVTRIGIKDGLHSDKGCQFLTDNFIGNCPILLFENCIDIIQTIPNTDGALHNMQLRKMQLNYKDTQQFHYSFKQHLKAKPNSSEIIFTIEVPTYNFAEDIQYYFKLQGVNKDWIESKTPTISYYSLPHGKFVFMAKALMPDGKFTNTINYTFQIETPWHKSWWFYSICSLAIATIIYSFAKYRIKQVKDNEKLKAELGAKILESELGALRAQMNPHFIFNSLNSINSFIVSNNGEEASNYLGDFSSLIRLILENSKNEKITLAQEIDTLQYYLKLEALRFKNKFNYEILFDQELPISIIKIPPMIIQPYIENAIWHGLMHKEDNLGKVSILFNLNEDDDLIVIIEDNGIGREAAKQFKSNSLHKNKSYGMLITEDRLQLIQEKYGKKAAATITDLYNEKHIAKGTKVVIIISNEI
jgi:hypothetical protein